jgi:hypothetical protein
LIAIRIVTLDSFVRHEIAIPCQTHLGSAGNR